MKNIYIVNHATAKTGSANYLEDYLLRKKRKVFRLSHPLDDYKNNKTYFVEDKNIIRKFRRTSLGIVNLPIDFLLSVFFLWNKKIDIFIGANNFDTLTGIVMRKFGKKINTIIFFGSDYSPNRFGNPLLDKIYKFVEKKAVSGADYTISNSDRAQRERLSLGLAAEKSYVIPNGIYIENPLFLAKEINKDKYIFIGSLTREHGLLSFLKFFNKNIKELTVIGVGEECDNIKEFCRIKGIKLNMMGAQKHGFVLEYLQTFDGLGLAPYNVKSDWTYYCSPSKVGEYIACGVPVVVSSVPEISEYVGQKKLGVVFDSLGEQDYTGLCDSIREFETGDYHHRAEMFYRDFNRDYLYGKIDFMFQ